MTAVDKHLRRLGDDYGTEMLTYLPQGQAWPRDPGTILDLTVRGLADYYGFVDSRAADLLEQESDPRKTIELLPDWERNWGLPDPCWSQAQTISQRQQELVLRMTMIGGQSRQWYISVAAYLGYEITISEYRPFMVGLDRCGDNRVYGDGSNPMFHNTFVKDWLIVCNPLGNRITGSGAGTGSAAGSGHLTAVKAGLASSQSQAAGTGRLSAIAAPSVFSAQGAAAGHSTVTARSTVLHGELSEWPNYGLGPPENRYYWTVHTYTADLQWFRCSSGQCGVDPHLRIGRAQDLECILNRWKPAHTQIIFDYTNLHPGDSMEGTP